jgi:hypothetical protein
VQFISLITNDINISTLPSLELTEITTNQVLTQLLQPMHLTVLVTVYCHLLLWHSLPSDYLLYATPNDFVTIGGLLLLRYDRLNELPISNISSSSVLTSVHDSWMVLMRYLLSIKVETNQVTDKASSEPLIWSFRAAAQNCHCLANTFALPNSKLHDILITALNQWPSATLIELYIEMESDVSNSNNRYLNDISINAICTI